MFLQPLVTQMHLNGGRWGMGIVYSNLPAAHSCTYTYSTEQFSLAPGGGR
jgi:hypothetical protein